MRARILLRRRLDLERREAVRIVGAVLPRQEEKPFAHGAEVAGRKVRDGEEAPPLVRVLDLQERQASAQNIASGLLLIEQIVHHKDVLRLAGVGIVRKAIRGDDRQVDGLGRLGSSLEGVQLIIDALAVLFRQYVFP